MKDIFCKLDIHNWTMKSSSYRSVGVGLTHYVLGKKCSKCGKCKF